jgi:hypothetical protein
VSPIFAAPLTPTPPLPGREASDDEPPRKSVDISPADCIAPRDDFGATFVAPLALMLPDTPPTEPLACMLPAPALLDPVALDW